MVNLRLQAHR
ncbi:hypothetical protein D031_0246A, partial [Vibrio parahaemolyticus VP-48]